MSRSRAITSQEPPPLVIITLGSFCGGSRPFANWLDRDGLLGALDHVGLTRIDVAFDDADHPQGPSLCILARR